MRKITVCVVAMFLCSCMIALGAECAADKPNWVKQKKIRAYWSPPYELIEPLHDTGFNVIIPRWETAVNPEQIEKELAPNAEAYTFKQAEDEIRRASMLCKKLNMRYFPCLNVGAIKPVAQAGFENNPRRYHDGKLPCPLDEVYWDRVMINRFDRILEMLTGEQYRVDGLMIDPEMYYFNGSFLTLPCYCQWCAADFVKTHAAAAGLSDANATARPQWLKDHNLAQEYNDWQSQKAYELVKKLERAVHANRPELILGFVIYDSLPWLNALAKGLSGNGIPIMICTEMQTYSGAYDDSYLAYEETLAKQVPVPFINCPGIWVNANSSGETPKRLLEVIPANLYHRTIRADGYFLYASDRWGGTREKAKPFTDVFAKINAELDTYLKSNGSYKSSLRPQPLPVNPPGNLKSLLAEAQGWQAAKEMAAGVKPLSTLPQLREPEGQTHVIIFKANKGDRVQITMYTVQLGHYIDKGSMSIFGPDANCLGEVVCDYSKSKSYDLVVPHTGAYAVVATANSNAYTIDVAGAPWVIATREVKLNRGGGRLFFYVPAGMKSVKLNLGGGGEAADFTVYEPNGRTAAVEKTVRDTKSITVKGTEGVWCVEVSNIEDDTIFGVEGMGRYAISPENLFIGASH